MAEKIKIKANALIHKEKKTKEPKAQKSDYSVFYKKLNEHVELTLITGTVLTGVIDVITKYEVLLKDDDGNEVVIPKHAILIII